MKLRICALLALTACTTASSTPPSNGTAKPLAGDAAAGVADEELASLLTEHWEATMKAYPMWATQLGDHRYDDRIFDRSQASLERIRAAARSFLGRAKAIPEERLSENDRTTRALFIEDLENNVATEACHFEKWSLSPRDNPVTEWNDLAELHPIESVKDGRNYLARLDQAAKAIDDTIANLRLGKKEGWYPNAESTRRVLAMADDLLAKDTAEWTLAAPAKKSFEGWSDDDAESFRADLVRIAKEKLHPAFVRYRDFVRDEIASEARPEEKSGIGALPFGKECYQALIRGHVTLPLDAKAIHQTGLDEIARINGEMRALGKKLFGTDDLQTILMRLRTDQALYFSSAEEIEEKAKQALGAAKAKIPEYFGVLPKADCVVRRIPDYEAPFTTIAYYRQPVPDGSKPGEYFVNVYEPKTRPKFEAEALAFHESIPGHHVQIAIAQELPEVPAFRKHLGLTVFVEGWALYTEQLADDMGLYSSDLDRMGMHSFEAWRAARLVVDTGIHSLGWSREQAKQFMTEHTALALNNIDNEVDRYIVWPGQALGYKLGQMEIWKLRREAEQKMGDKFDLRHFHDAVLGGGSVTLPLLRARVEAYTKGA
jgi:uncharacterized protein (DUF885 family)